MSVQSVCRKYYLVWTTENVECGRNKLSVVIKSVPDVLCMTVSVLRRVCTVEYDSAVSGGCPFRNDEPQWHLYDYHSPSTDTG